MTTAVTTCASPRAHRRPERTCVACRGKADPDALLRLARAPDGRVIADWRGNLGGRGAHVCPRRACITAAIRGRMLERAFRAAVRYPDPEELVGAARSGLARRLGALLGSAAGSRKAVSGTDAVRRSLELGSAVLVLVASDAAERKEIERRAADRGVPSRATSDKAALGGMLGRRPTAIAALVDRGLAAAVSSTMELLEGLQ